MSFKLTCPECRTQFPIAAGLLDDDGKRLAAVTGEMEPALARASLAYLRFFKPEKTALSSSRAIKILQSLNELIGIGTVCKDERGGLHRRATARMWVDGMDQMHQHEGRLRIPLANHNYLRSIVFAIADGEDGRAEQTRNKDVRESRAPDRAPVDEMIAWYDDQKRRGFITAEDHEKKVNERKQMLADAGGALKGLTP